MSRRGVGTNIYKLIATVGRKEPPPYAPDDHLLCFFLEAIVRGDDRILTVGPELDHLRAARPPDTKPAWERMGDPVRCVTRSGLAITMWPWLDLKLVRERVELLAVKLRTGRTCWVSPMLRAHYRDKIRTGFFGV